MQSKGNRKKCELKLNMKSAKICKETQHANQLNPHKLHTVCLNKRVWLATTTKTIWLIIFHTGIPDCTHIVSNSGSEHANRRQSTIVFNRHPSDEEPVLNTNVCLCVNEQTKRCWTERRHVTSWRSTSFEQAGCTRHLQFSARCERGRRWPADHWTVVRNYFPSFAKTLGSENYGHSQSSCMYIWYLRVFLPSLFVQLLLCGAVKHKSPPYWLLVIKIWTIFFAFYM